jgi:competence protein ComEA
MLKLKLAAFALSVLMSTGSLAQQPDVVTVEKVKSSMPVKEAMATNVLDINTADANQLTQLKNIGLKKAQQIIEYRNLHGKFTSIDQLKNVKGIGEATIAKNRTRITVATSE